MNNYMFANCMLTNKLTRGTKPFFFYLLKKIKFLVTLNFIIKNKKLKYFLLV
jgi:hypothetical protein